MFRAMQGRRRFTAAMLFLAASPALVQTAFCDALYFQERVINRPASQVPFPIAKIAAYANPIGFPQNCALAVTYSDSHNNFQQRCTPGPTFDPPLLYQATYPTDTVDGALFSEAQDIFCESTGVSKFDSRKCEGGEWKHWNLLGSQDTPGWSYVDVAAGRYLQLAALTKHFLDDPLVGVSPVNDTKIYFRSAANAASVPGDQSFRPLILDCQQSGNCVPPLKYSVTHPLDNQNVGERGATLPGTNAIARTASGDVLVPITLSDGIDHTDVTSNTDAYVLRGEWGTNPTEIKWFQSAAAQLPYSWSTRGADEPSVLEIDASGRCMMIVRGSNENHHSPADHDSVMAGHYWLFQSTNGCKTWKDSPTRWGFSDGTPFFAPAANSLLYRSPQNNKVYWIGNISASNSNGNWPRTTLIAAEVDLEQMGIIKDTATIVDRMVPWLGDSDLVHLNNHQVAIQPNKAAFGYFPRWEETCQVGNCAPLSWYQVGVASPAGVSLSATASDNLSHVLSWSSSATDVVKWHIRRRYLSGEPLSDLWVEVGDLPGSYAGTTLSGYQQWQEAEYEIVAERSDGTALTSNRVVARFAWSRPRLSFFFPPESAAGAPVPRGTIVINWTVSQSVPAPQGFRLMRRYFNANGNPGSWQVVGNLPASLRATSLSGYQQTDRFELYLLPLYASGYNPGNSNVISVHFPVRGVSAPY